MTDVTPEESHRVLVLVDNAARTRRVENSRSLPDVTDRGMDLG